MQNSYCDHRNFEVHTSINPRKIKFPFLYLSAPHPNQKADKIPASTYNSDILTNIEPQKENSQYKQNLVVQY
jgi:hypothetical protein